MTPEEENHLSNMEELADKIVRESTGQAKPWVPRHYADDLTVSHTVGILPKSGTSEAVLQFAHHMEAKLAQNRHKGDREGWLKADPWELFWLLRKEVRELDQAMTHCQTPDEVTKECADIANFAMMVADTYRVKREQQAQLTQHDDCEPVHLLDCGCGKCRA
jgi:hypothetical protein